jgi:hypothetical protein
VRYSSPTTRSLGFGAAMFSTRLVGQQLTAVLSIPCNLNYSRMRAAGACTTWKLANDGVALSENSIWPGFTS